jgi:hypothetical protein
LNGFGSINNQKSSINNMKIALGVTGGIAAYKAAEVLRLLQDRGIRVQVIMTRAAQEFVKPLTFAALSGEKVITGMFSPGEEHEPNIDSAIEHIAVAQSIDALVVVPATADILAHFAQGIARVLSVNVVNGQRRQTRRPPSDLKSCLSGSQYSFSGAVTSCQIPQASQTPSSSGPLPPQEQYEFTTSRSLFFSPSI